jgi:hypothetical protein
LVTYLTGILPIGMVETKLNEALSEAKGRLDAIGGHL